MADDEVFALFASLAIGLVAAGSWYLRGLRAPRPRARGGRTALLLAPPAGLALLWVVLATAAAVEVRTDVRYQVLFVAMGTIWAFLLPRWLALVGISYRDDALERHNGAAGIALAGAVLGLVLVFAGSNMGEGPSIWNTVVTALAGTVALGLAGLALLTGTSLADAIAIERDAPSGLRFAGWIAACGIVLGRAAAGNWVSTGAMMADMTRLGWPVLVLLALAIALERPLRPRVSRPHPALLTAGVVPAVAYVVLSLAYVLLLPGWRGNG